MPLFKCKSSGAGYPLRPSTGMGLPWSLTGTSVSVFPWPAFPVLPWEVQQGVWQVISMRDTPSRKYPPLDSNLVPIEGGGSCCPSPACPKHLSPALLTAHFGGPGWCGWAAGGSGCGSLHAAPSEAAGQRAPGSPGTRRGTGGHYL